MEEKLKGLIILLLMSFFLVEGNLLALEIKSNAEAVNNMGKLRMLSWRTLKNYTGIGMDSAYGDPKKELHDTVADFNAILEALNHYTKDPKVQLKLKEIGDKWKIIQSSLDIKLQLSNAKHYYNTIATLKKTAHETVGMMSKNKSIVVGKAGRLRAVSQAIAAAYVLKTWGMEGADEALKRPMKRFRGNLDFLKKDPATDSEMSKIIQKLEKTYLFFQVMGDAGTMTPSLAIKKTNRMLKDADKLTQLYVNKLNKQKKEEK